jgi:hypothetical protein
MFKMVGNSSSTIDNSDLPACYPFVRPPSLVAINPTEHSPHSSQEYLDQRLLTALPGPNPFPVFF